MDTSALDEAQYISLTTFKKDGTGRPTPVWVHGREGRYEVTTTADAWKAKRIRNNANVEVAVCDMRGRIAEDATVFTGTAVVVDGEAATQIRARVLAKYGLMGRFITLRAAFGQKVLRRPPTDMVGIVITITGEKS